MYRDGTIAQYIADAAGGSPAPGGGSVSALVAALGTTMSSMAANFTIGRKKYASVEPRVKDLLSRLEILRTDLLRLVDDDVAAYTAVAQAVALPKETPQDSSVRAARIQQAMTVAMDVPLRIMEKSLEALECVDALVDIANPNLLSDVGVSAVVLEAALRAAKINVEVNLTQLHDASLVSSTTGRVTVLAARARELHDRVLHAIARRSTRAT